MARKRKPEEHQNHDRWLISYADFITLLFAFFVIMYSVSSINEGKYRVLSDALVASFRSSSRSLEPIQVGNLTRSSNQPALIEDILHHRDSLHQYRHNYIPSLRSEWLGAGYDGRSLPLNRWGDTAKGSENGTIYEMAEKLEKVMPSLIHQDLITISRNDLWIKVEMNTSILFPSGSAKLQKEALPILRKIARILGGFPNLIRVEGFTDSIPINTVSFPSNWELSAGRAASVVHLFAKEGVDPRRMAAVGFGEYRPIADNSTAAGRNKNRRVVILILESAGVDKTFSDAHVPSGGETATSNVVSDVPNASDESQVEHTSINNTHR